MAIMYRIDLMMFYIRSLLIITVLTSISCTQKVVEREPSNTEITTTSRALQLPSIKNVSLPTTYVKKLKLDSESKQAIETYLSFLGLEPSSKEGINFLQRLSSSSTQFLFCPDQSNWQCLESTPKIMPRSKHRLETLTSLGKKILVNRPFVMKTYFTQQWPLATEQKKPDSMMAKKLTEFIMSQNWDAISMALYGIDDIEDSMKSTVQSLYQQQRNGANVRTVFDIKEKDGDTIIYPYDGTPEIFENLNNGKTTSARLENPISRDIMHNKFFVFKKGSRGFVWTGTTNVSRTCMGFEENANMSVIIDDSDIAQVFQTEFEEMYGTGTTSGYFHKAKRPNTHRYFQFQDGHEVKIHFSPTDDGEHRSIIPFVLSAQKNDEIRISMFGTGGIELVRALQFAAAKGVKIRILLDRMTGFLPGSWANDKTIPNLYDVNPYLPGSEKNLEMRFSTWSGLNHLKTATLTRAMPNGIKKVETLVVGSQNWSASGNDDNDENMLTIRNLNPQSQGLESGLLFNNFFDKALWPNSKFIDEKSKN